MAFAELSEDQVLALTSLDDIYTILEIDGTIADGDSARGAVHRALGSPDYFNDVGLVAHLDAKTLPTKYATHAVAVGIICAAKGTPVWPPKDRRTSLAPLGHPGAPNTPSGLGFRLRLHPPMP